MDARSLLRACVTGQLKLLVLFSVVLPSGAIYGFNLKIALAVLLLFSISIYVTACGSLRRREMLALSLSAVVLAGYGGLGMVNGYDFDSVKTQFSAIVATLILPTAYLLLAQEPTAKFAASPKTVGDFIYRVAMLHCVLKIVVISLIFLGFFSLLDYTSWVAATFGVETIQLETEGFIRINVPADLILPLTLFWALFRKPHRSVFSGSVALIFLLMSILISYSRYIWMLAALVLMLRFARIWFVGRSMQMGRVYWVALFSVLLIGTAALLLVENPVTGAGYTFVKERYAGDNAAASDSERDEMYPALIGLLEQSPWLGNGIGAHSSDLVRFEETPWNYELQWLALSTQFGLPLIMSLLLLLMLVPWRFVLQSRSYEALALYLLWVGWLASGFINCFLLTSAAGVIFLFFITVSASHGAWSVPLSTAVPMRVARTLAEDGQHA